MMACERRAYQEAKAIYRGSCQPIAEEQRGPHDTGIEPDIATFKERLYSSIDKQPEGPV
jgi:hypothetical protein